MPDTVSRQTKLAPACTASPLRAPGAGQGDSSCAERQPVLGDPQRERALLQQRRRIRRLRDRPHSRGERDREDRERDEDLD